jgi:hypothetical protein
VVDGEQDLVGEVELAAAERVVQQVVRRRDRAEQRVLDREAARVRATVPDRGDDVADLAARHDPGPRPAPPRRGLRERAMRALDGDEVRVVCSVFESFRLAHDRLLPKEKAPPVPAGLSRFRVRVAASARSPYRTRRPRRDA